MKTLITLLICFTTLSIQAQYSVLSITVNPDKNRQILVDGKSYAADNISRNGDKNKFTITDLKPGQHKIMVFPKKGTAIITSFTLRQNHDMKMVVLRNSTVTISEHRNDNFETTFNPLISDVDFASLVNNISTQDYNSARLVAVTGAMLNPDYVFNGKQAIQLIQLIDDDDNRLAMAKLAFSAVSPASEFNTVIQSFNDNASKREIAEFITNSKSLHLKIPMKDEPYLKLVSDINEERLILDKDAAILSAFSKSGNQFTTLQARELIELSGTEDARLLLSQASYKTVTDQQNFTSMNELLNSHQSKNALAVFLLATGIDASSRNSSYPKSAMTDEDFIIMSGKVSDNKIENTFSVLSEIFSNPYYKFNVKQVRTLIEPLTSDGQKLQMLMASYRTVTNREYFSSLITLLETAEKKKILLNYVNNYIGE